MNVRNITFPDWLSPYVSETGRVAFFGTAFFVLASAVIEVFSPGFVTNWISPKSILLFGLLSGFFALLPFGSSDTVRRYVLTGWISGIAVTAAAFFMSYRYFQAMETGRLAISLIVVAVTASLCILMSYCEHD